MQNLDNAALQTAERTFCLDVPGTETCGAPIFEKTKDYPVVPQAKTRRPAKPKLRSSEGWCPWPIAV